jgi:hypothetical protein
MSSEEKDAMNDLGERGSNNPTQEETGESFHSFHKSHSNESGGSGGSNHSSGMLSIGNTSFGFTFDNDPMMRLEGSSSGAPSDKASEGDSSDSNEKLGMDNNTDANAAAEAKVANLGSLARSQVERQTGSYKRESERKAKVVSSSSEAPSSVQYSRNEESLADSHDHYGDEDDDDDDETNSRSTMDQNGDMQPRRKKKRLDERKRVERNAREKERSFRISKQINDLRNLLSSGGVIVPKGTKSSVLTEAANYIRMLQQHQYRSEM